jgi:hypothetical protein
MASPPQSQSNPSPGPAHISLGILGPAQPTGQQRRERCRGPSTSARVRASSDLPQDSTGTDHPRASPGQGEPSPGQADDYPIPWRTQPSHRASRSSPAQGLPQPRPGPAHGQPAKPIASPPQATRAQCQPSIWIDHPRFSSPQGMNRGGQLRPTSAKPASPGQSKNIPGPSQPNSGPAQSRDKLAQVHLSPCPSERRDRA